MKNKMEEIKQRLELAHQHISDLCQGKKKWLMSIPVNFKTDSDMIL